MNTIEEANAVAVVNISVIANNLFDNGAELTQVQQVLRHTNINHSIEIMKNQSECLAANAIFGKC